MLPILRALLSFAASSFRSRLSLELEVMALRHQLGVYQRGGKRPKLRPADRILWSWLARCWPRWREALIYVAMITYLLLSYLKFSSRSPLSLYELAKRVEVSLFDRLDIRSLLAARIPQRSQHHHMKPPIQLSFKWNGINSEEQESMKHIAGALRLP